MPTNIEKQPIRRGLEIYIETLAAVMGVTLSRSELILIESTYFAGASAFRDASRFGFERECIAEIEARTPTDQRN